MTPTNVVRLGRWTSADPGGLVDGLNLYCYVRNNPVNGVDRKGYETGPPTDDKVYSGSVYKIQLEDGTIIDSSVSEEHIATVNPTNESSWDASTAAWGLLRFIGGAAQAVAGMAGIASGNPAGIVVGSIATAKGYDDMVTGFKQMITGTEQESLTETTTEELYRDLGFTEQEAEKAGDAMDILLSAISPAGAISGAGKAPQLATAGSKVITAEKAATLEKIAEGGRAGSIAAQTADEVNDSIMYNKDASGPIGGDGEPQKMPTIIYRGGRSNASAGKDLELRPGEDAVSFRESISNPLIQEILRAGNPYIAVDVSLLPKGSVILDGGLPVPGKEGYFFAPGHISIKATTQQIVDAIIPPNLNVQWSPNSSGKIPNAK